MAKRFTADDKWDDPWFFELAPIDKLLWLFLLDACDHAGVWRVSERKAEFLIGESIEWERVIKLLDKRIERVTVNGEERWFIPKFLKFQYPKGIGYNKATFSVYQILKENGLLSLVSSLYGEDYIRVRKEFDNPSLTLSEEFDNSCLTLKDKDKDKDKDKVKEKEEVCTQRFDEIWAKYPQKAGRKAAYRHFHTSVEKDKDWEDINKALDNYLASDRVKRGYLQDGSTWFNNWKDWIEPEVSSKQTVLLPADKAPGLSPLEEAREWRKNNVLAPPPPEFYELKKKLFGIREVTDATEQSGQA